MLDVTSTGKLEFLLLALRQIALLSQMADLPPQQYFKLLTGPVARPKLRSHPASKLGLIRRPQPLPRLVNRGLLVAFAALQFDLIFDVRIILSASTRTAGAEGDDSRQKQPDDLWGKRCHGIGPLNHD